jgi:uncharacterized LabA/DUF88 family protein
MVFSSARTGPSMNKYIILADGENLVIRFQEMAMVAGQDRSKTQAPQLCHIQDVLAWHPLLTSVHGWSAMRVNYYTSIVGDEQKVSAIEAQIAAIPLLRDYEVYGQLCPRVFKKVAKGRKTKIVDISICIDALRHSFQRDVGAIFLLSGDGDYLPLIKEVMRNGTQVWVGAFSSGLHPEMTRAADRFIDLDPYFFRAPAGGDQPPHCG